MKKLHFRVISAWFVDWLPEEGELPVRDCGDVGVLTGVRVDQVHRLYDISSI